MHRAVLCIRTNAPWSTGYAFVLGVLSRGTCLGKAPVRWGTFALPSFTPIQTVHVTIIMIYCITARCWIVHKTLKH